MYNNTRVLLSKQSKIGNIIYNEIKKKFNRNPETINLNTVIF